MIRPHPFAAPILIAALTVSAPCALAAGMVVQPETRIYRTSEFVVQPQDDLWDVLACRDITVQLKITEEELSSSTKATVTLQTSNVRPGQDWETLDSLQVTDGDSLPLRKHLRLTVEDNSTPLGRFLRWQVRFSDTSSEQHIAFQASGACRD
ncbi:MAG: hypothetical protein CME06_02470 [Gemmatimonadetes bacterium]|nr:hypothetical protein [Gemmatimonadota bacterium]